MALVRNFTQTSIHTNFSRNSSAVTPVHLVAWAAFLEAVVPGQVAQECSSVPQQLGVECRLGVLCLQMDQKQIMSLWTSAVPISSAILVDSVLEAPVIGRHSDSLELDKTLQLNVKLI